VHSSKPQARTRDSVLRAVLKKIAALPIEVAFRRQDVFTLTNDEKTLCGSSDWEYHALKNLARLGLVSVSANARGWQRTASPEKLHDLSSGDVHWIWTRYKGETVPSPAATGGEDEAAEDVPAENAVAEDANEAAPEIEPPRTFTLEEKVDMVLVVLPKIADRLAEVAEALKSFGVSSDLREAILESRRILKELE